MSEATVQSSATTSGAQSASSTTTSSSAESAQATNGQIQHATKAELDAFKASVLESIQKQSEFIGGKLKELKQPKTEAKTDEAKTLTQRQEADEKRAAFQMNREKFGALKAAAIEKGVPEKKAAQFARYILGSENANNIIVEENGYEYATRFRESDESIVPIAKWVSAFLQTDEGEIFLPAVAASSSDGQGSAGRGSATTQSPFVAMTFEQIMEERNRNPDGFAEYLEKHSDDWAKKQKTLNPASFKKK